MSERPQFICSLCSPSSSLYCSHRTPLRRGLFLVQFFCSADHLGSSPAAMNSLNQSFGLAIRINVGSRQHCGDLRIEVPAAASADVLSVDERLVRLLYSITCRWLVEGATGRGVAQHCECRQR